MFTAQTYEAVAKIMREQWHTHASANIELYASMNRQIESIVVDFAEMFEKDNENFKLLKFLKACAPTELIYESLCDYWKED